MPNYDYKCEDNPEHITTRFFKFKEPRPEYVPCDEFVEMNIRGHDMPMHCAFDAYYFFSGTPLVITYSGEGMVPPSQRAKGSGGS